MYFFANRGKGSVLSFDIKAKKLQEYKLDSTVEQTITGAACMIPGNQLFHTGTWQLDSMPQQKENGFHIFTMDKSTQTFKAD